MAQRSTYLTVNESEAVRAEDICGWHCYLIASESSMMKCRVLLHLEFYANHLILLSFSLLACRWRENVIEKQNNSAICTHWFAFTRCDDFGRRASNQFRATVSDDDNEFSELTVVGMSVMILSDWASVSPAGESFATLPYAAEDTNVIAEVRDSCRCWWKSRDICFGCTY